MSHFNPPNIQRRNCVRTTRYKGLLGKCIVQHVKVKSVFLFQPIKRLVSTTVKSAKPAAMFWTFNLWTINRQLCCLAVMVHILLQGRRIATTRKKYQLHFCRNFAANHNQAYPNLNQQRQKVFHFWHNCVENPMVDTVNQNFIYILVLYTFSLH